MADSPKIGKEDLLCAEKGKGFNFKRIAKIINKHEQTLNRLKGIDGIKIIRKGRFIYFSGGGTSDTTYHPFEIVCDDTTNFWVNYGTLQGTIETGSGYTGVPTDVTTDVNTPNLLAIGAGVTVVLKVTVNDSCEIKSSEIVLVAGVQQPAPNNVIEDDPPGTLNDGEYHWIIGDVEVVAGECVINQGVKTSLSFKCCGGGAFQFLPA